MLRLGGEADDKVLTLSAAENDRRAGLTLCRRILKKVADRSQNNLTRFVHDS
jgi:hypothetical protein